MDYSSLMHEEEMSSWRPSSGQFCCAPCGSRQPIQEQIV